MARLNRAVYVGNFAHQFDGDRILELLETVLFDQWNEVPAAETWATYDATTQWLDAENSGLGEIDTPGDYELHSENGLDDTVYNLASRFATSGLGYLYEDSQGRIGYADSTHRGEYLATNGYVDLDGNHAIGPGLSIVKRAGDVKPRRGSQQALLLAEYAYRDGLTSKAKIVIGPGDITKSLFDVSSITPSGQGDCNESTHWQSVSVLVVLETFFSPNCIIAAATAPPDL